MNQPNGGQDVPPQPQQGSYIPQGWPQQQPQQPQAQQQPQQWWDGGQSGAQGQPMPQQGQPVPQQGQPVPPQGHGGYGAGYPNQQQPYAQQNPQYPQQPGYPNTPGQYPQTAQPAADGDGPSGNGRRKLLIALGIGIPVATLGAVGVKVAMSSKANANNSADGGVDPNNYNPSTLPTAAGAGGISTTAVQTLISKLNRCFTNRDRGTFVSAFASGATQTQAGIMFDNIGQLSFDFLQYQLIGQGGRQFTTGNGSDVAMDVALVHKLTGIDGENVAEWYRWTLTQSGTSAPIVISNVTGSPSINAEAKYVYYPSVWDATEHITVFKRNNVVVVGATAADAAKIQSFNVADSIETAVANNRNGWSQGSGKTGVSPGVLAIGTSSRDAFYSWFSGRANQYGNEAGLTIAMITAASLADTGPLAFGGSRITLDLTSDYFSNDSGEDDVQSLVQHEDAHNLVFPLMSASSTTIPLWVVEGFADFMASRTDSNPLQSYLRLVDVKNYIAGNNAEGEKWDGTFPSDANVYSSDLAISNGCYGLGALAYYYIQQEKGLAGAIAFLEANYIAAANGTVNGSDNLDAACNSVLGYNSSTLNTNWQAFVHSTVGA